MLFRKSMPEVEVTKANTGIEPTAVHQERIASLKRHNWLFVYAPLIIFGIILLVLTGLMFWGALSPRIVGTREFVSGVADIIIILTILPLSLMCLIPPLALGGFVIYQRRKQGEKREEYGRLQRLFWRIEGIIDTVHHKIEANLSKVGQPIIRLNAIMAFVTTLLDHIVNFFRR